MFWSAPFSGVGQHAWFLRPEVAKITLRPVGICDRPSAFVLGFWPGKKLSGDGLKMLPGGSWTDFETTFFFSQNFSETTTKEHSHRPQETSWRVPGHFPEDPKIDQNFMSGTPREPLKLDPWMTPGWSLDLWTIDKKSARNGHLPLG